MPIVIEEDIRLKVYDYVNGAKKVLLLTDENVFSCFEEYFKFLQSFDNVETHIFKIEEVSLKEAEKVLKFLAEKGFEKDNAIIAIGGRKVLNVAAFCSHNFNFGLQLLALPTTLICMAETCLSMVFTLKIDTYDNIIANFAHPAAVLKDIYFLTTLSENNIKDGISVIIRCAASGANVLFDLLNNFSKNLEKIIKICSDFNSDHFKPAHFQFGEKMAGKIADFSKNSHLSFGELLALGMQCEARYLVSKNQLSMDITDKIDTYLKKFGLSTKLNIDLDSIEKFMND